MTGPVMRTPCGNREPAPWCQSMVSVAAVFTAVFTAVAAVVPPVLTAVTATVDPVGDDDGPADGGGGPAPASCC